jgi:hypothetical protein
MVRAPNDWPQAQSAFHTAYLRGEEQLRIPVLIRWWQRGHEDLLSDDRVETWVAVFTPSADQELPPLMAFPVDQRLDPPSGETEAVLVGEMGLNAVCGVETQGRTLWPTYNPAPRAWHARRSPRVGRPPQPFTVRPRVRLPSQRAAVLVALAVVGYVLVRLIRLGDDWRLWVLTVFGMSLLISAWVLGRRWRAESTRQSLSEDHNPQS